MSWPRRLVAAIPIREAERALGEHEAGLRARPQGLKQQQERQEQAGRHRHLHRAGRGGARRQPSSTDSAPSQERDFILLPLGKLNRAPSRPILWRGRRCSAPPVHSYSH